MLSAVWGMLKMGSCQIRDKVIKFLKSLSQ